VREIDEILNPSSPSPMLMTNSKATVGDAVEQHPDQVAKHESA
jgi:hypothetical protein